ncbi:UNVERIFIED_CONTAM: hypothetical protein Scaly_1432600 [Sesamum calycinum]|uniref:Uncharacterized protein n=1 Tax=Sesamum calycinum TaxID=2727403 RepID=A0AAW2PML6_9LAMI
MAKDLEENGAVFIKQGETSQSISLSDLFTLKDETVTPVLKSADPPVRANVLSLSTQYSVPISEAVKNIFLPYFDKAIWFQNSSLYHFSMFHASHHIAPVPATETEIEAEANAVKAVAESICPLHIVLDRVVLTSTGVLLGCWQEESKISEQQIFHDLVNRLNNQIRGLKSMYSKHEISSTVSELWYVEEYDLLALAVNGNMKIRKFKLGCSEA